MIHRVFQTFFLLAFVALALSCSRDNNHPGYIFYPDMTYSQAWETYTENPVFESGQTMLPPAEGTVPRGYTPYPYMPKSFDEQVRAGKELVNPFEPSDEIIAAGKIQYDVFCANCHGGAGKGDGHLYTSKLFTAVPTSLGGDYVQNKPDGELFHVITLGSVSGLMGPHGNQIATDDRWKIVRYVRSLAR